MLRGSCHCGTRRKATGSSFATNLLVLADEFALIQDGIRRAPGDFA